MGFCAASYNGAIPHGDLFHERKRITLGKKTLQYMLLAGGQKEIKYLVVVMKPVLKVTEQE